MGKINVLSLYVTCEGREDEGICDFIIPIENFPIIPTESVVNFELDEMMIEGAVIESYTACTHQGNVVNVTWFDNLVTREEGKLPTLNKIRAIMTKGDQGLMDTYPGIVRFGGSALLKKV